VEFDHYQSFLIANFCHYKDCFLYSFIFVSNLFYCDFSISYKDGFSLDERFDVTIHFAGHPIMIVTEYMENGSLDTFLRVS
jgi:hypothetical protein